MPDTRRDPWAIALTDPDGQTLRLPLDGQFLQKSGANFQPAGVPLDVFIHAVKAATTARQPPEFRLRGRGPQGDAGHGWTWSIAEGW